MEGETLTQAEMQEINEIETNGEITSVLEDRLRANPNYQKAVEFWRSEIGQKVIKRNKEKNYLF